MDGVDEQLIHDGLKYSLFLDQFLLRRYFKDDLYQLVKVTQDIEQVVHIPVLHEVI